MNRIIASPVIRKPSLAPLPRRARRLALTAPLAPAVLVALRFLVVALVLWSELLSFRWAASYACRFDDRPSTLGRVWDGSLDGPTRWTADSRWRDAALRGDRRATPFHVLVVADPQLLDMRSYPGRPWALRWLGVRITDLYARKAWTAVTSLSRGNSGGGVDAVVWLGDLLDSATETVDRREHASYVHRFHLLFPLPRASTSSFALSPHTRISSPLTPPIPSITVPGNHDLGLHRSSSSLAAYARERFEEAFGPTWGIREWNGWEVVWVDAMALLEDEYWEGDGGQYSAMKRWLDEMEHGLVSAPRILLSHIPLYRPEGTSCGRQREHARPIAQGHGRNYQNELTASASAYLLRAVRPSLIYSGDDHDYCFVRHEGAVSPLDGVTPVTETTVKAFSMAMGIRRPGYHLLSLYAPLPASTSASDDPEDAAVSYTYTQTNCVLPDALGTYLHVYAPLALVVLASFLLPKLAVVARGALVARHRRRGGGARRSAVARANGSAPPSARAGASTPRGAHRHQRSLSATLLGGRLGGGGGAGRQAEDDADAEDVEAQFPGLLGGPAHLDSVEFGLGPGEGTGTDDDDDGGGEVFDWEGTGVAGPGLPVTRPGVRTPGGGHVRRVSRVWLWEGGGGSRPPVHTRAGSHSHSHSHSHSSAPSPAETRPWQLVRLASAALDRLASNTPLRAAVLRPGYRVVRAVWRKGAAPFARLAGGTGCAGLAGQALAEAVSETWTVAWPGVATWVAVAAWYSL
ncbi:hypothetical protein JCM3770_004270 [Rhodotorula araucariae]